MKKQTKSKGDQPKKGAAKRVPTKDLKLSGEKMAKVKGGLHCAKPGPGG